MNHRNRVVGVTVLVVGAALVLWPTRGSRGLWAVTVSDHMSAAVPVRGGSLKPSIQVFFEGLDSGAVPPDVTIRIGTGIAAIGLGLFGLCRKG